MPVRNIRRRYLRFNVYSKNELNGINVYEGIKTSIKELYGLKGLIKADPKLIEYDPLKKSGILRCTHNELINTRAAIASITKIQDCELAIHVLKVSGTIKALKRKTSSDF
ncbi:Rpp14/Pop5 family protein [Candidatus Bathyarchaeota archaeon]|nr:Rpp14/Pop5 family protein [Candidatus Bathyarchaeota archaeon]